MAFAILRNPLGPRGRNESSTVRLHVESGPKAGASVELDRARTLTIGSAPDCALRLDEPGIAAQHAVVKALRDEGFGIKALAPGLRVNGSEVEAAPLADGDTIEIGASRIVFEKEERITSRAPSVRGFQILRELEIGEHV